LQVINQEDLAAILPDVVTTEANAGFDGFEDVSSEPGKTEKKDTVVQDSGSDVELPDQIVSEAIKRIHVDSEDADSSDVESKGVHRKSSSTSSSSEEEELPSPVYSSSLLQQFVEKTEILSAQCERLINGGRTRKPALSATPAVREDRVKRKTSKSNEAPRIMPELEPYPQSDGSPDSGIQSVPGSPVNDPVVDPTPPVLRPVFSS